MDAQPRTRADDFADAVAPHYAGLVPRLTLVVGDREGAEDLAQDAYLRAYRAWDRFDGRDVRAWLHTIGLRLAFNERDRRRRFIGLFGRRTEREPRRRGRPVLDRCPSRPAPRTSGRPPDECRRRLHPARDRPAARRPAGTVASWLSRAKAHLREALTDD